MILDELLDEENLNRWEGSQGVKNLAILSNRLGYSDSTHFGQFKNGCYGDLINFLEDNPGAVEAVVNFIRENQESYGFGESSEYDGPDGIFEDYTGPDKP